MIRTFFIPQNNKIMLSIPQEYIGKELEVIAFPIEEVYEKATSGKKATFDAISIDTKGYKFDREEANAR